MTKTQLMYLALEFASVMTVIIFCLARFYQGKKAQQKYRLYALRDSLYFLTASGQLSQKTVLFALLRDALTASIKQLDGVESANFLSAVFAARTTLEAKPDETLMEEIRRSPESVQKLFLEVANTMIAILKANSLSFRLYLYVIDRKRQFPKPPRFVDRDHRIFDSFNYFDRFRAA